MHHIKELDYLVRKEIFKHQDRNPSMLWFQLLKQLFLDDDKAERKFHYYLAAVAANLTTGSKRTANEMLAAEQYLHRRNQKTGIHFLPSIEALSGRWRNWAENMG